MSSMECCYLPSDIISEILSRASSDTLGRCRTASKEWNQMIYDSKFKKVHSQMTNIVDGFVAPYLIGYKHGCSFASINDKISKISLDFVPGFDVSVQAVSANHGIILCKSDYTRRYRVPRFFVCKPQIKLFQQIPNPITKFWTEGVAIFVLGANPFRYKIVRISFSKGRYLKNYQKFICEVFDSKTWTWRRLKDIELPFEVTFESSLPAVTVGRALHWLMNPNLVFSFDVEKEEWKTLRLPVKNYKYDRMKKLVQYEGKLALICGDEEDLMHTWVLENYRNEVWKKKFVINMKDLEGYHRMYAPIAFYGSDIIVVRECSSLMYYDFKNGKFLKEVKPEKGNHFEEPIYPFWSDSETCRLRGTSELGFQPFEAEGEETQ